MPEPHRCQRAARRARLPRRALTLPHTGGSVATHSSQGRLMSKKQAIDLEKALRDLEKLVEELESGDLPLEKAMKKFEDGIKLTRSCQTALKEAEQKVEILLKNAGGDEALEDFDVEPDES
jgi:exodeoxyribonuclease VII small subunit